MIVWSGAEVNRFTTMTLCFTVGIPRLIKVTPTGMGCTWTRILESNNTIEILNDLCFELEAEADLASESGVELELLIQLHICLTEF
jgi:hypothetical protein